jgi:hypothetical protein
MLNISSITEQIFYQNTEAKLQVTHSFRLTRDDFYCIPVGSVCKLVRFNQDCLFTHSFQEFFPSVKSATYNLRIAKLTLWRAIVAPATIGYIRRSHNIKEN